MKGKETRTNKAQPSPLVVAVDLSGHQVTAALVDEKARILARRQGELVQATARADVATITKLVLDIAATAERGASQIEGISVSVPGTVDPRTERVSIPSLEGWDRVALRETVERGLDAAGIDIRTTLTAKQARAERMASAHPAIVINPRRSALVAAEAWCGVARGRQDVVFLAVDDGIEAGILAGGRIISGTGNRAGAVGWFALSEGFKDEYATHGCLEAEAAAPALVRRTIEEWSGSSDSALSRLTAADAAQLSPSIIIRAARSGDATALKVVAEVCGWIGRAVADVISLLNPQVVVIGGELGLALRLYLNQIRREARLWAHPAAAKQCRILSSTLGPTAGLLGAARLAWWRLSPPHHPVDEVP